MPATNVRSAVAVRPPRPMTLPRSSGWTCTSTVRPRRLVTMSTRTSSGLSTIPRTRCSTASTTTELTGGSAFGFRGGLNRRFSLGRRRRLLGRRLLRLGGLGGWAVGGGQCGVEEVQLARLWLGPLQRALLAGQALELLPVTGDLEQLEHGLGGLGAHGQPVLRTLRVDLDQARLLLGVVAADDLDRAAVAACARVGDGDAVLGIADLAKPGQLDLDSHGRTSPVGITRQFSDAGRLPGSGFASRVYGHEATHGHYADSRHCARTAAGSGNLLR